MTSSGDGVLARLHIRRQSPIPAFLQLKSQFEYLIVTGKLPPGSRLPSIRQVAQALEVGPATVVRAYKELEGAGLAVSNEGIGFFVIRAEPAVSEPHARIRDQVSEIVHAGVRDGVSIDQILQIFLAEVAEIRVSQARPKLILLGKRDGRVDELVMHLAHALADMEVEVTGIALEDMAADPKGWLARMEKAPVASLMFDVKQARALVGPHGIQVIPMLGTLRDDARDRIIHLPAATRVGVVSGSLEFVDGMITAITSLNANVDVIGACDSGDQEGMSRLFGEAECIVYGTLAQHVVEERLPRAIEAIEFRYIPDDSSVRRLRRLLRDEQG